MEAELLFCQSSGQELGTSLTKERQITTDVIFQSTASTLLVNYSASELKCVKRAPTGLL